MSFTQTTTPTSDRNETFFYGVRQRDRHTYPTEIISVEAVADVRNLVAVAEQMKRENGDGPGRDGIRLSNIGHRDLYELFRPVSRVILEGNYRPAAARQVQIPKASGGHRTLNIRNAVDRVVAKATAIALGPFWDKRFSNGSHGFRPGRSPITLLRDLFHIVERQNRWVLTSDDIKGAFDFARTADVLSDFAVVHAPDFFMKLVAPLITGGDSTRLLGIDQGCPLSALALNVRLQAAFDGHADTLAANPETTMPWFRYADNIVVTCQSVSEGQHALAAMTKLLAEAGLTLKGENGGQPVDLRCRGTNVQLLGFTLFQRQGRLAAKLNPGALHRLEDALKEAHHHANPPEAAQAAIRGWIHWYGPAFCKRQTRTVRGLLHHAQQLGFGDLPPPEHYLDLCEKAHSGWLTQLGGSQGSHHDDGRLRRPHPPHGKQPCEAAMPFAWPLLTGPGSADGRLAQAPLPDEVPTEPIAEPAVQPPVPQPGSELARDLTATASEEPGAEAAEQSSALPRASRTRKETKPKVSRTRDYAEDLARLALQHQLGKRVFTVRDVALLLGCTEETVRVWCRREVVQATKRDRGNVEQWEVSLEQVTLLLNCPTAPRRRSGEDSQLKGQKEDKA